MSDCWLGKVLVGKSDFSLEYALDSMMDLPLAQRWVISWDLTLDQSWVYRLDQVLDLTLAMSWVGPMDLPLAQRWVILWDLT